MTAGTRPEPKTELDGLNAIAAHMKKSVATVRKLIRTEGLPAEKIGGEWASDTELIREWREVAE